MYAAMLLVIKDLEVVRPLKNRIMKLDECELFVQIGLWFHIGKKDNSGSLKFITSSGN